MLAFISSTHPHFHNPHPTHSQHHPQSPPNFSELYFYRLIYILNLILFNFTRLILVTLLMMRPSTRQRLYYRSASAKSKSEKSQAQQNLSVRNNTKQIAPNTSANSNSNNKNYLFGLNKVQMGRLKRNSVKMTHKSVEELFEENLQLRKQNNALALEVAQLRGKFQANAKNDSERGKELDLEFEKQLYWGGSKTHLISGIKHQYQKLQKKYKQLETQNIKVKAELLQTKKPQENIYSQELAAENRRLVEKLHKLTSYPMNSTGNSKKVTEAIAAELGQQIQKLQRLLKDSETQIEILKEEATQKQKKALFLEKLLIEKDNSQYHGQRKIKKLDKTIQELKVINSKLNQQIHELVKKHKEDLRKTGQELEICKQQVREESKKQIQELRTKIENLLEDKNELENCISKMKMNSSMIHSGSSIIKLGDKRMNSSINKATLPKKDELNEIRLMPANISNSIENGEELFKGYESEMESETQKQKKPRVMRTAQKKHSHLSKKLRKVQHSQVIQIGEFVKLRMIAANINQEDMKKYFNRDSANFSEDVEWEEQHIKFSETKSILKSPPFQLEEEAAYLLARYLIEDCNEEFVYCDEANENKREIVKSIIKSLVGNYNLADEAAQRQIDDFKNKYLQNFYSALKTYYPQGRVGRRKFTQILANMGTQLSQKSTEIIIARVISKSTSLLELQYEALLEL